MNDHYNLYGAGGHAAVVASILPGTNTQYSDSYPPVDYSGQWIVAIGDIDDRRRIAERLACSNVSFASCISKNASVDANARVGIGSVVMSGAVIETGATVGDHVIVNTGSSINHHCDVGDFSHVGPGATICGGVTIGSGVMIGAGATVINGITIGDKAVIGAGAVVVRNVEANCVSYGNPSRTAHLRT